MVGRVLGPAARGDCATRRGVGATVWRSRVVGLMVLGALLLAMPRVVLGQTPAPPVAGVVSELGPAEAMRVFGIVEAWVRAGAVGQGDEDLPSVQGAAITLRVGGVVVGRSAVIVEADSATPAIRGAAMQAITDARARMPRTRDAMLAARSVSEFWSGATISIELAGPLVPLASATYDEVDADVRPGIEGVAVRAGARVEAVFPASMLARNVGPGDALTSAITRVTGGAVAVLREDPGAQPAKIAELHALNLYRFRTIHVAQPVSGATPMFLDRGGRTVRNWPRGSGDLRAWCATMARHITLRRRVENGVVEYSGVYRPATDRFEPPGASALEEILAVRALMMFVQMPGIERGDADAALRAAIEIADTVARRADGARSAAADATGAALWTCVLPRLATLRDPPCDEHDDASWPAEWRVSYRAAVARAGLNDGERCVTAFAMARRSGERWPGVGDPETAAARARASLDAVYASTPPGQLVTQMPWLGWGELCMKGDAIAAAPALREVREAVYAHLLRAESIGPDNADLAGGVVFTGSRSALPTWHTARVGAFLASALADPRLTDGAERPREMARLSETLRFLRQLTADEPAGFMYADPARATGGVRIALWDQRMPLEATALTLIAGCEALRAARPAPQRDE